MIERREISRRGLLRTLGLGGLALARGWTKRTGSLWQWAAPQSVSAEESVIFRTVPPAESHITWVHDNAASEAHYLPESMASGCAFFDYDNDGWMDIFLVNTGPCDYFQPSADRRRSEERRVGKEC
jgi:hypothetical protein